MTTRTTPRQTSSRRLLLAGGFAVAIAAAPAAALFSGTPAAPTFGACVNGETADTYTNVCTPDLVPNSSSLPAVDGIPCTGGNSGQCIGLSENAPQYQAPNSTIGSSPTVHGSTD
ncbi:intersectin-EH-binding protein Ibp1 [Mycolicibacterium madagascariense]|uniref:Intersectin-EH-binding protein Ibp1 n=1 Tax=Mycolicibacterium madagascariense TaxID=212765 RepID=A0A7I7XML3_9MYCO|nr:intersectin-EH binding protein Ibp1 [Mycolicibacterium madagascariense]MCV7013150.1 intersectin-EH binding protein Ibp1 [Mycolicibacterium madagascariense]BBZ30457.1 intersectin-EH-binding protein Ibp1 [Mycolicibacterium madagascariense]